MIQAPELRKPADEGVRPHERRSERWNVPELPIPSSSHQRSPTKPRTATASKPDVTAKGQSSPANDA